MRTCSKCLTEKELSDFYKEKGGLYGVRSICKQCDIKRRIKWHSLNKDKDTLSKCRYVVNNKDKVKKSQDRMRLNKPDYYANKAKESRARLGEKHKEYRRNYDKHRRNNDALYKIRRATSNCIAGSLKRGGYKKESKTAVLLGCDWCFFKQYIETKFHSGMSWDNYGDTWTIDHICPCSQAQNEEELIKLQNYKNLEPSINNFIKSDRATPDALQKCQEILNRGWV